jgi:hypothetical protein
MSMEYCHEHDYSYDTDHEVGCPFCEIDKLEGRLALAQERGNHWRKIAEHRGMIANRLIEQMYELLHDQPVQDNPTPDLDAATTGEVFCLTSRQMCELQDSNPPRNGLAYRPHPIA